MPAMDASGVVLFPGIVFVLADGVPGAIGLAAYMPFAVEPADRAAQGVMECLVAVTIFAQGFIIDIAVVIGEISPVVSDHQPFVVVFDAAADTPSLSRPRRPDEVTT